MSAVDALAGIRLHALAGLGRSLPADTDRPVAKLGAGSLLLIHVPPGDYAHEVHRTVEYVLVVDGRLVLEDGNGAETAVAAGQMAEIPPGLRHRFGGGSDAVVVTVTQLLAAAAA